MGIPLNTDNPRPDEVQAHLVALRAMIAFIEYIDGLEDIEDSEEYRAKIEMYIKGAGSMFFDQIDATGAYRRTIPETQDPDILEYTNSLSMIVLHAINELVPRMMPIVLAQIVDLEWCDALRRQVVERIDKKEKEDAESCDK